MENGGEQMLLSSGLKKDASLVVHPSKKDCLACMDKSFIELSLDLKHVVSSSISAACSYLSRNNICDFSHCLAHPRLDNAFIAGNANIPATYLSANMDWSEQQEILRELTSDYSLNIFQIVEFWREADILSKIHHPNVVAFYGVVQDGPGGILAKVLEGFQVSPLWLQGSILNDGRNIKHLTLAVNVYQTCVPGSKDILMRVIAQNLPPETTIVEKVMTPNPECATVDTSNVDALHTIHDGKFLHIPVVDRDGEIVAVVDVIHIPRAAVATLSQVGSTSVINNKAATTMMQKFWDSVMALPPNEDDDETRSENSLNPIS
ncbi:hypothetical protein REPUB_Repub15cG0056600 [Reevesia pubescens]